MRRPGHQSKTWRSTGCSMLVWASWIMVLLWCIFLLNLTANRGKKSAVGSGHDIITSPLSSISKQNGISRASEAAANAIRESASVRGAIPAAISSNIQGKVDSSVRGASSVKTGLVPPPQDDMFHVVFSTDCSHFQDWQSLLMFYSAVQVGQPGTLTRIASGCNEKQMQYLKELYAKMYPHYHVHFTPDFKKDEKTGKKYDFYNKPYGLEHWLDNADPPIKDGVVIALIDPDMIFLRPLTANIKGEANQILQDAYTSTHLRKPIMTMPQFVKKGSPAAQLYGLGAPWTTRSRNFNRTDVCGPNSPCMKVDTESGELYYSVGPPYIAEKSDLLRITKAWTKFVPKVYSKYPELLAEMYAYSMAAAHEELPHYTMLHYMLSNTEMDDEGWKWVDALGDDVCQPPVDGIYYPGKPMATIMHYCQFFRAGEIGFQKRRIPGNIFKCDSPLLASLPPDLGKVDYKNRDGDIIKLSRKQARRNAFSLCVVHSAINRMLIDYKKIHCGSNANLNMTLNLAKDWH